MNPKEQLFTKRLKYFFNIRRLVVIYVQNADGAATHPNTRGPPSFSSSPCYLVNVLSIKGKSYPRPSILVRASASHVAGEEGTNGVMALAVDFALVLARDVGEE